MKKKILVTLLIIFIVFLALEACGFYLSRHGNALTDSRKTADAKSAPELRKKSDAMKRKIANLAPKGTYLVIDTAKNRIYVRNGNNTLKEIVVSTGSGSILKDPAGNRQWIFDTPRGERSVQLKKTNPVWTKPDWAFIEEGETVPKNFRDRLEEGVLGDYALDLGDGYMIHGTLYTRLLGRNVTHGCVRVGDKDLKELYSNIPVGTKVLIF
ncbi:MAG: L,D-transpeptidase [Nitrospiraceae bacterium]|nr:MAG: L,D-transpeptidase [Nitrospiraceae bacterium]